MPLRTMAVTLVLMLIPAWSLLDAQEASPLDVPYLQPCTADAAQPAPPARWRATYLMAPFTAGQLVLADIVQDSALSTARVRLYGVERGTRDLLVVGSQTYAIESDGPAKRSCRSIGDTGWRPWSTKPFDPAARCVGTATAGGIKLDWWKVPIDPAPASSWLWFDDRERTPFRTVYPFPGDGLAPLGRYALSYRVSFEPLSDTDLGSLVAKCRGSSGRRPQHGRHVLQRMLRAMDRAPDQAHPEAGRLMPALDASCGADPFTRWPSQVAITGIITPWDADENPYPVEVVYDWTVPGQRTRIFSGAKASDASQDFLLLGRRGFTVTHHQTGSRTCRSVLPGPVRPDWQERAPCRCRGVIRGVTTLSPLGTTRILACPLATPRQAWAWYHVSGTPALFMVTSQRGDEGAGLFALFDYRDWRPGHPAPSATFRQPAECAAAQIEGPRPALRCGTCHMDARR